MGVECKGGEGGGAVKEFVLKRGQSVSELRNRFG